MKKQTGTSGEQLVSALLRENGWQILATQWHCRWGELDVVARDRDWLIFVEVKTRRANNWDSNGLLAIAPQKQEKLYLAATAFLEQHPDLEKLSCRFDVALVRVDPVTTPPEFALHEYLMGAFQQRLG